MSDSESSTPVCGSGSSYNGSLGLRVGAIFIILATSAFGTLFPVLARRVKKFHVPTHVFNFTKYFGSGIIIATAFIHLLGPAFEELGNACLGGVFTKYDWAPAIAMMAVFTIFIIEFFAFRMGSAYLLKRGLVADHHHAPTDPAHTGHEHHVSRGDEPTRPTDIEAPFPAPDQKELLLTESGSDNNDGNPMADLGAVAQILGVAILEFGVIFHSVIIGLTLATTDEFDTLFIVIIFHQMFEGLGLGSRLAFLPLPPSLNWVPIAGALTYACMTPIGMAIGLGVRHAYDSGSYTANIVTGVLDSLSAGILLYTGLVELLAHEFIFHDTMKKAPMKEVLYSLGCVLFGAGIMALLGRWA